MGVLGDAQKGVNSSEEGATFGELPWAPRRGAFSTLWIIAERSSLSRTLSAASSNEAPLTPPDRAEQARPDKRESLLSTFWCQTTAIAPNWCPFCRYRQKGKGDLFATTATPRITVRTSFGSKAHDPRPGDRAIVVSTWQHAHLAPGGGRRGTPGGFGVRHQHQSSLAGRFALDLYRQLEEPGGAWFGSHTTMGHDLAALSDVGFITTFQRGTEWAATGKVTQKVPADFPAATKTSTRAEYNPPAGWNSPGGGRRGPAPPGK